MTLDDLGLPIETPESIRSSSLAYHLVDDQNQAHGIADVWRRAKAYNYIVPLQLDLPFYVRGMDNISSEMIDFLIMHMLRQIDPKKYGK